MASGKTTALLLLGVTAGLALTALALTPKGKTVTTRLSKKVTGIAERPVRAARKVAARRRSAVPA